MLYELHASGSARAVSYCARLAQAAATLWDDDLRRSAGIRPGMPLAEATALARNLPPQHSSSAQGRRKNAAKPSARAGFSRWHLEMHDPLADRLALEELAEWCRRFSPIVGCEEADSSLLLDVTGLGPLFGGEQALADRIVRALHERALTARVAIADTLGAAWAVAHFADLACETSDASAILSALRVPLIVPAGQTWGALAALPVEALRLPPETCALLAEIGLQRIEQLAALPRDTLRSRFGPRVLENLDRACGAAAEAIVARAAPEELEFAWSLEYPTDRRETIELVLAPLVARACDALAQQGRGVLRLQCRFEYEHPPADDFVVGLYRPSASARHVGDLVRLKLESLGFREPVATIRVAVLAVDRLEVHQQALFDSDPDSRSNREAPRALATLVDRLSNRLGPDAVVRPRLLAGAQPEFACQYQPLSSLATRRRKKTHGGRPAETPVAGDRPLRLEPKPLPLSVVSLAPEGPPVTFRLAGRDERVVRVWGPERIETGWWRTRCVRRDYYQVETARGARYWLFRHLNSGKWFLHGVFA